MYVATLSSSADDPKDSRGNFALGTMETGYVGIASLPQYLGRRRRKKTAKTKSAVAISKAYGIVVEDN